MSLVGLAYYNIAHPSTQGTNQSSTSHQEATLAKSDDAQAIQNSSEQIQGACRRNIVGSPLRGIPRR